MKIGSVLALFGALLLAGSAFAARKCPVGDAEAEKAGGVAPAVEAFVRAAPNCEQAYGRLESCALGSTADNPLSDLVVAKCEPAFVLKANAAVKHAYKEAKARCDRLAEKQSGSMAQSFAAVCLARVARNFSRKHF